MSKGGGGGGGQQTVNTQVEPPSYAKPFLEFGLAEAKDRYTSGDPNYYTGSTVVGFSPETEMALTGIRDEALDPNSMTCLLYTSPSPRDGLLSRMPSSA